MNATQIEFPHTSAPMAMLLVVDSLSYIILTLLITIHGYHRNSLSLSGALVASVVGLVASLAGPFFLAILLGFFLTSSRATRVGKSRKMAIQHEYKIGGQRDAYQVICNSVPPSVAALLFLHSGNPALKGFYLGYYASCQGDTFSSELGILSSEPPRLITNLRVVPPGTNGGVTGLGLMASLGGGGYTRSTSLSYR